MVERLSERCPAKGFTGRPMKVVHSNELLWNAQQVLTKLPKHRIVSGFHADAFTHYHRVSRLYVPATDETDRVVAIAIPPYPSSQRR